MAIIQEDYVSFEMAKLLKEKGFDEPCWSWYHNGNNTHTGTLRYCNSELEKYDFSKATLAHVMKWLRKVHNWTICISPYWPEGDMRNKLTWYYDIHSLIDNRSFRESSYTDNYTEAVEASIKYCLENLI